MTEFSPERFAPWRSLLIAHSAAMAAIERDLERQRRIPMGWYDVLLELRYAPDRTYHMQELAEHVVLSRSRVSRIVDELAREGYVERQACPADRRSSHAVLTDAGADLLRSNAPAYLEAIERHFLDHIPERARTQLVKALAPVLAAHGREGRAPGGGDSPA